MQSTTNYQLVKQELTDRADITQISGNWDKIDTQLKKLSDEKFDKTGGTITGKTTISKGGLSVTGGTTTDTLTANGKVTAKGGVDVTGTLTASGKITGSGGLAVTGGTSTDTLTTSGAATVAGKLTAKNGLDVTGAVTLQNVTASTLTANTFQALDQNAFRSRANVKRGTNPSAIVYSHWSIFDNAGWGVDANRLGRVQYSVNTDGTATIGMYVNKFSTVGSEEVNGIAIQWLADGTARVSLTHHPQAGSNDKQIATTNWVRSLTATTSEYGLVKLADETALLSEADDATLTVDASYELNDFRRMSTAYTLGDKVNCAFNFGVFLECTQAGTTSAETLDTRNVTHGQVISDGTVQWTVRTHVKSINGSVPDASGNVQIPTVDEAAIKNTVLSIFFPVGAIYMSAVETFDPNTEWGGTWVKIQDAFLYGSGTKEVGITGGEENVTLTIDQIPDHNHSGSSASGGGHTHYVSTNETGGLYGVSQLSGTNPYIKRHAWTDNVHESYSFRGSKTTPTVGKTNSSGSHSHTATINNAGGGQAHNNMPPYVVVNIWKRTA